MAKTMAIKFANVNAESVKNALTHLKEADKEARSLSGCIKTILRSDLWGKGYKSAFALFGIDEKNLTPANIFAAIPANLKETEVGEDGKQSVTISKWVKNFEYSTTRTKDNSKTTITYKMYKGKRVYKWEKCAINSWTPKGLFGLLVQVAETKGAMPAYSDNLAEYWKGVEAAQKADEQVETPAPVPAPAPEATAAPAPKKSGRKNGKKNAA